MLNMSWLFLERETIRSRALPHDVRDMYYDGDRPLPLPCLESREGVINQVREIDDALANAVRMEDE
jgi:hypothetical protein